MTENPTYEELEKRVKALEKEAVKGKQAEAALIKSETLLNATGQIAKVGGWEIDGETQKVFWTKEIYNITEVPPDYDPSSLEKEAIVFFNEKDQSILEKAIQRAFEHGEPYNMEFLITTAKGNQKWVQAICEPIAVDGKVIRLGGTLQDITERKQAEAALRESEDKFESIFNNAIDGILLADIRSQRFVDCNKKTCEMLGYSADEIKSLHVMDIHPREDLPYVIEQFEKQAKGELTLARDIPTKRKDGSVFYADFNSSRMKLAGKDVLMGIFRDITDIKEMQEEKAKLEDQLIQAQKMESIGTLAGGIAHDFNNILSPIMIHSEMAKIELPPDSPVLHNLKEIIKAGGRAKDMVQQILTFSRKEEGERAEIKISPVLREVLKMLRSTLPTTIDIQQNLEVESDVVLSDPTQIHQIMLNLGTNAAHAMREKGGTLEVSLVQEDLDSEAAALYSELNPGSYLKLTVSDTGSGIDAETIQRIFEPYFTTKEVGEGTGMGLALTHGIVKSYGGDITVESEPDKGTTFNVYLPRIDTLVSPVEASSVQLPRGTERILFVDDEKAAVDAIQPMLQNLGYNVKARTSSIEALQAFRNNPAAFDLVITDQTMPNMTGKDLAKELMSIRSDIPVILCTGFSEQIDERGAEEMGISAFVMKPIVMREMAHMIRQVMDLAKQGMVGASILVMDDEEQMRTMLRMLLEREGYEVVEASDGKEGLRRYRENPTDLIITDLIMPEKEGIETIMELRRDFPDVKIIAMSGGGRLDPGQYLRMAKNFGVRYTFAKPFEKEDLLKAVRDLLT